MTGFAEKNFTSESIRLKIAVKSLNHRFFDWSYKGVPLGEIESRLRAVCQRTFHRGRIEVFIEANTFNPASWNFSVNEALLKKIVSSFERVSVRMGRRFEVSLDQIMRIPQIVELSRKELSPAEAAFIERSFAATLDAVLHQRMREGRETAKQLRGHIRNLAGSISRMEALFKKQPGMIQRKMKQRLMDLNQGFPVSEDRLAEETGYLIQRYDLAEEITRLKSHLGALRDLLASGSEDPVGKKLDFLAQEITREANTSSSKAQDIAIIKESMTIKNEVESIRQQAQNIE